jgi:Holliday junction resolvase RusA-like endonuclease
LANGLAKGQQRNHRTLVARGFGANQENGAFGEVFRMIQFWVPGLARPKGSAKAMPRWGLRYPLMIASVAHLLKCIVVFQDGDKEQNKWAKVIATCARFHIREPLEGPVCIGLSFRMPRLKAHFNSKGELKPGAPVAHSSRPDLDKLFRLTFDALTGIAWKDDSQVSQILLSEKIYADAPGVMVWIRPAGESEAETEAPGLALMEI